MAELQCQGFSSYLIYLFFLCVICLSTSSNGESHVAYDVANPFHHLSESFLVSDIVSHPRVRRDATDNSTQQSNESVTPGPVGDPTGLTSLTMTSAPSDGNLANETSNDNSANTSTTQNGNSTAMPTKNPFDGAPIIEDSKDYYVVKSNILNFNKYWTELAQATRHEKLSRSHRVAAVIPLRFKFPFYGHLVDNITIATGGFIYMSPFLHQWLTATQYIAPLMANFDLSLSSDSNIYYLSLDDSFYVEWRNVVLQDQNDTGSFSFQVVLNATGEITFVYKDVPLPVNNISRLRHPVKVGVSDAYYNDTYIRRQNMRRRTIYEYHRISVDLATVRSKSVVVLQPLPTCNTLNDCTSCTEHKGVSFDCQWCNTIGRCSDGLDWYRQHWDRYGCQRTKTANPEICQRYTRSPPVSTPTMHGSTTTSASVSSSSPHSGSSSTRMSQSPSTSVSPSSSTTATTATSQETTLSLTTPTKTTATLPATSFRPKSSTLHSPTSSSETSSQSTSTTTKQPSASTSTTFKPSSETTSSTTQKPSESTSSTTQKPSESTTSTTTKKSSESTTSSTTKKSSESTTRTTEKSSEFTTRTTEKSSESTSSTSEKSSQPTTQSTEESTQFSSSTASLGEGNVARVIGHGFCSNGKCGKGSSTPVAVIVIVILMIAGLAAGIGGWVFYAYTHPTSRSGMWLMEHRPSQMKAKIQFWKSSTDSGAAKYKMESEA